MLTDEFTFEDEMFFQYCNLSEMSRSESIIWHYTGSTGLMGITKNVGELAFWFTNKDYLNDASEGQNIRIIYDNVCNKSLKNQEISSEFYEILVNVPLTSKELFFKQNGEKIEPFICDSQLYVCCFAKEGDSLNMWRHYLKGEPGYSLKMSTNLVCQIVSKYESLKNNIYACDVIYDDTKKESILHDKIIALYKVYLNQKNGNVKKISDNRMYLVTGYK